MPQSAPQEKKHPILGGYYPLSELWDKGGSETALFPSEVSARWYIRQHKDELVDAEALLMHTGRLYFHPELFQTVVKRTGLEAAASSLRR